MSTRERGEELMRQAEMGITWGLFLIMYTHLWPRNGHSWRLATIAKQGSCGGEKEGQKWCAACIGQNH